MNFLTSPAQRLLILSIDWLRRLSRTKRAARQKYFASSWFSIFQGLGLIAALLIGIAADAVAATPDKSAGGVASEKRAIEGTWNLEKLGGGRLSLDRMIFDRGAFNNERDFQPLVSAIRLLFPSYRFANQPICSESADSDMTFRVNRVKYIYVDLQDDAARQDSTQYNLPKVLELAISPIGKANAFVFPAIREGGVEEEAPRIVLTDGLLSEISGSSELAFVIGHELGHLNSEHLPISLSGFLISPEQQQRIDSIERQWEFQADSFAAQLLEQRGLPRSAAGSALSTLARVEHGDGPGTHPNIEERLQNLGFSIPSRLNSHRNLAMSQTAAANVPRLDQDAAQ